MEKPINKLIEEIIRRDPEKYIDFYVENDKKISDYIQDISGIKTDNYLYNFSSDLDKIRFSAVFSDFSNIYSRVTATESQFILCKQQKVTVNEEIMRAVLREGQTPILHAAYFVSARDETINFLRKIEPLVVSGRMLLHNQRTVIGLSNEKSSNGGRVWKSFSMDPNSPSGNWLAMEASSKQDSIQINFNSKTELNKTELFDITVPYLKGISFKELDLILKDNQDLLSSFRVNLNTLIQESKTGGKSLSEIKNDIVRPAVDKVSNEFKKIQGIHKLKVAGTTFSTVTLGLVSLSNIGIGQMVSGFLGTSGLGLLVKHEVDYQKKLTELKDNPFYLMWALKKGK